MIIKPVLIPKREVEMKILNSKKKNIDKRMRLRKPYSGQIFFSAKSGFAEGRLKIIAFVAYS